MRDADKTTPGPTQSAFAGNGPSSNTLHSVPFEEEVLYLTGFFAADRAPVSALRISVLPGSTGEIEVVLYDEENGTPSTVRGAATARVNVSVDQQAPLALDLSFPGPVAMASELFYVGFTLRGRAKIDVDRRFPFIGWTRAAESSQDACASESVLERQLEGPQARPRIFPRFVDARYDSSVGG